MDNLTELRRKRREQFNQQQQARVQEQQQIQQNIQQQIEYLESVVKPKFSKEALTRYGILKAAHPEKAAQVLAALSQHVQQITSISDDQLKQILLRMEEPKRETTIRRV